MGKIAKGINDDSKVIHPNSRKAKQLAKIASRNMKMQKKRHQSNMKYQLIGKQLMWFKEQLDSKNVYSANDIIKLIMSYIKRNDDEVQQIKLKQNIGQRTPKQHTSRIDMIQLTKEKELSEFSSSGFETIDLTDPDNVREFKLWNGELKQIPKFKLRKFKSL